MQLATTGLAAMILYDYSSYSSYSSCKALCAALSSYWRRVGVAVIAQHHHSSSSSSNSRY
eukprot:8291468-Lingulodinium_polyedra.AAC.1